jgi:hypothetical protein
MYRKHWGKEQHHVDRQGGVPRAQPGLDAEQIAEAMAEDPEAGRAEWYVEWRADLSDLITPEALAACTAAGRTELPPSRSHHHVGYVDAAGGGGADSFALVIAHLERHRERVVLDVAREW